jgi:hypothetical protein
MGGLGYRYFAFWQVAEVSSNFRCTENYHFCYFCAMHLCVCVCYMFKFGAGGVPNALDIKPRFVFGYITLMFV